MLVALYLMLFSFHKADPYEILVTDGRMHDIDNADWDRWYVFAFRSSRRTFIWSRCEYILYRGLYRTGYARISRGSITDTELQVGRFVLPRYGHAVTNETEAARYLRSWKEDLPETHVSSHTIINDRPHQHHGSGLPGITTAMRQRVEKTVIITMSSIRYAFSYP
jgi:hypothetical protein